ncbi:MAG TPA: carbohydrate kinase family protein [Clostridiales bacterium]|nr:carbohydrate kinase family protein [Clostridiales bacterium]
MKQVLVAGSIVLDTVMTMDPAVRRDVNSLFMQGKTNNVSGIMMYLGGEVGNTGLALHKLGIPVMLVTKVGDDRIGTIVRGILQEFNARTQVITVENCKTTAAIALTPPGMDKISFLQLGAGQTFMLEDVPEESLKQADLFHFGYPTAMKYLYANDGEGLVKLFAKAKATGVTTSVDMTLTDIESESGKLDWNLILHKMLPYVDIYMPSIEETLFMLDREKYIEMVRNVGNKNIIEYLNPDDIMRIGDQLLAMGPKIVVIKMGKHGLYLRTAPKAHFASFGRAVPGNLDEWSARELWCEAIDTNPILSTTGAGDTAIAGFLGSLTCNYSPEEALKMGSYTASLCIGSPDTVSKIEDIHLLEKQMQNSFARLPVRLDPEIWQLKNDSYASSRDRRPPE